MDRRCVLGLAFGLALGLALGLGGLAEVAGGRAVSLWLAEVRRSDWKGEGEGVPDGVYCGSAVDILIRFSMFMSTFWLVAFVLAVRCLPCTGSMTSSICWPGLGASLLVLVSSLVGCHECH